MGVAQATLLYYRTDGQTVVETLTIPDWESVAVKRSADPKNNTADITIKNAFSRMVNGRPYHKWVDSDGKLIFKAPRKVDGEILKIEEKIEVFANYSKSKETLDTTSTSPHRLFTGYITEIEGDGDNKKSNIRLKCVDRSFVIMNRTGVGVYANPSTSGTLTARTATTATDAGSGWTEDEHVGKVLTFGTGASEKRYTIKSNTSEVLTLQPDDDLITDGIGATDTFVIQWTAPSITRDQLQKSKNRDSDSSLKVLAYCDFENSERYQIASVTANSITLTGANMVNTYFNRWCYVSSGTAKGTRFDIKSNTVDTLTLYTNEDITALGITTGTDYLTIAGLTSGIETMRPDGSAYPGIPFSKTFKPLHEFFSELSAVENTNTDSEINSTPSTIVIAKPLKYHLSPTNVFYLLCPRDNAKYYLDSSVNAAITPDEVKHTIISRKFKNKLLDTLNFIIFRIKEFDGVEYLDYVFDPSSGSPIVQDCYKPYFSISNALIKTAYENGEITTNEYGATINAAAYDGSNYPSWWEIKYDESAAKPTSEEDYIALFKTAAIYRGRTTAWSEINGSGSGKWGGSYVLEFERFDVNEVINATDGPLGVPATDFRIKNVTYNLAKSAFRTTIDFQEDEDDYETNVS